MKLKTLVFVVAAVIALGALFVALRPAGMAGGGGSTATADPARAPDHLLEFVVENGQRKLGPQSPQVMQGETILLRVTSDRADELHLHGYDLSLPITPGQPAELRFVCNRAGRFEYELHQQNLSLGAIEVLPR